MATRSPILREDTEEPTAWTEPEASWPIIRGCEGETNVLMPPCIQKCTSEVSISKNLRSNDGLHRFHRHQHKLCEVSRHEGLKSVGTDCPQSLQPQGRTESMLGSWGESPLLRNANILIFGFGSDSTVEFDEGQEGKSLIYCEQRDRMREMSALTSGVR
jgi:hypothetical protein